jgi:hypothetical protein
LEPLPYNYRTKNLQTNAEYPDLEKALRRLKTGGVNWKPSTTTSCMWAESVGAMPISVKTFFEDFCP